jgi:hypothetical protein
LWERNKKVRGRNLDNRIAKCYNAARTKLTLLNEIRSKEMHISVCGLICDECEYFNKNCSGCNGVKGQTFWAVQAMPNKTCPLYYCAVETKGQHHCGECKELPCPRYYEMKEPKTSEEEHKLGIAKRVKVLQKRTREE